MKIQAKRGRVDSFNYGDIVFLVDKETGLLDTDNPVMILNTEFDALDEYMFVASLSDGFLIQVADSDIAELADATLTINQF